MSTPGQATPSASAAAPSQATGSSAAPATPTSPGMAPSAAPASATRTAPTAARPSTTPRLLRVLRGVAAAVALLTGVAASGTLSTDGVAATPTALAQEWTATQRASVLVAEADQALAQRVVDGDTDESRAAFERITTEVSRELGTVGDDGGAPEAWATYLVAAERAGTSVGYSAGEGQDRYGTARQGAADAGQALQRVADQRVDALSGPRSELTGVLGTLATLALLGVLVVLALRTRRIVNVPVLAATAITAGLTYLSVNPGSLPVDYEAQLASPATTATALASVHEARAAQLAESVGAGDAWQGAAAAAGEALAAADEGSDLVTDWEEIAEGDADGASISASQEDFEGLAATLEQRLDDQLAAVDTQVGAPALITAGAALLLGVVAAALAWTGITRRLQDYR